ncbi:MAG: hypothetical protein L6254_00045 [Candidatus Omnitrophica bacterium]|nr:hypothetical protein [Candidatus Omnitrophota bacterium]
MRITLIPIFAVLLSLCFMGVNFAQMPPAPGQSRPKEEFDFKKFEAERKKAEEKSLEMLKQQNPQMYEQMMKQRKAQEGISRVINDYYQKTISYETAKARLYPLVKESLQGRLANLDNEINLLEKKLSELKKAKKDPDYLIGRQIDRILGKLTIDALANPF